MELLQDRRELSFALQIILQKIGVPERILEIGLYKGGTFRLWQTISSKTSTLIGIDLADYTRGCFGDDCRVSLIFGKSSDNPEVIRKVSEILGISKLDLLFIDGNHGYEMVKSDYESYSPFVRDNGLIVFHDTGNSQVSPRSSPKGCQVQRFWRELLDRHTSKEYYEFCMNASLPQGQMGTGIIVK